MQALLAIMLITLLQTRGPASPPPKPVTEDPRAGTAYPHLGDFLYNGDPARVEDLEELPSPPAVRDPFWMQKESFKKLKRDLDEVEKLSTELKSRRVDPLKPFDRLVKKFTSIHKSFRVRKNAPETHWACTDHREAAHYNELDRQILALREVSGRLKAEVFSITTSQEIAATAAQAALLSDHVKKDLEDRYRRRMTPFEVK